MRRLLLLLLACPALAQVETVKFRYGDDPRWAEPAFDDRDWMDGNALVDQLSHLTDTWQWARYRLRVPDRYLDPMLGVSVPVTEVYVEGRLVGRIGQAPPRFRDAPRALHSFLIPPDLLRPGRQLTVALRLWRFPGWDLRRLSQVRLAPPLEVYNAGERWQHESANLAVTRGREWGTVITLLLMMALLLSGRGSWADQDAKLLGTYLFVQIAISAAFVAGSYLDFGVRSLAFMSFGNIFFNSLQLELLARFAGVSPGGWLRAAQAVNLGFFGALGWTSLLTEAPAWMPLLGWLSLPVRVLNFAAAIGIALLQRAPRIEDRLLPGGLVCLFGFLAVAPGSFTIGDATFSRTALGSIVFGGFLLGFHLFRLKRTSQAAERLRGQMVAAQRVQEMLLTGKVTATPGYRIEPLYSPAEEVGGDFFRILPVAGNRTLLVVGDVSGKGLRADARQLDYGNTAESPVE